MTALLGAPAHAETSPAHPDTPAGGAESAPSAKGNTPSPADAYVYIGWPNNGEVINASRLPDGRFRVWFGLRNMGVAPAGVNVPNTGHHHLLIDTELPPLDQEIPSDRNHLHFGHGQTETVLELSPGRHTLQLLLGDKDHFPHKPPVYSKVAIIIVKENIRYVRMEVLPSMDKDILDAFVGAQRSINRCCFNKLRPGSDDCCSFHALCRLTMSRGRNGSKNWQCTYASLRNVPVALRHRAPNGNT